MSIIEGPPQGNPEAISDLEIKKAEARRLVEESGTSMWFSGTGSGKKVDIFVPLEGSYLRPLPNADKLVYNELTTPPDVKWAVRMSSGRTVFEDALSGEIGVRYMEMRRDENGVYDYDVFDCGDEPRALAELEEYLEEVFSGEPVRLDLTTSAAFQTVYSPDKLTNSWGGPTDLYIAY
jgi:hypothetical protein